jgi:uncharacterized membrane protein (UPF0127 family)
MTLLRITAILGLGLLLSGQSAEDGDLDSAFRKDTLIISADQHTCWFFDIYIASNSAQRSRGLMHVRDLPEFTGMIFIYSPARILSMWMKNTYISLDMLFIRGDGTVASIATNTTPLSLESVASVEPVNMVLELNAGVTEKLGIGTESRIVFTNME